MVEVISNLHFIRPLWLIMVVPVILIVWICFNARRFPTNWHKVIHPSLINYLLSGKTSKKNNWSLLLLAFSGIIACIALAGPAWNKTTVGAHKDNTPLVVIVDMSPAILAADLSPNRLSRVSYKLQDLLKQRTQGNTSLIVYSGSAHTVAPLTDDTNTLVNLIKSLSPAIMPQVGNKPEAAIELALNLLKQSGHENDGDILLLTYDVAESQQQKITSMLSSTNVRLSVIGIGTQQGGPILLGNATYLKDQNNNIQLFKLQESQLNKLATKNKGYYNTITVDNTDLNKVLLKPIAKSKLSVAERNVDHWQDMGIWLVLLLLPLGLFAFRWLYPALLVVLFLPLTDTHAWQWQDLWLTKDQQGKKAFEAGDYTKASMLFENPSWRAESLYSAEEYSAAASATYEDVTAADEYNRGNALAKAGDFTNSIIAYDKALAMNPNMQDAIYNKNIVEQLLKQQNEQQKQQQNQDSKNSKQQDKKSQEQQQSQQAKQEQQSPDSKDSAKQQQQAKSDQQSKESQGSKQQQQAQDNEKSEDSQGSKQQQQAQGNEKSENNPEKQQQQAQSNKKSEENPEKQQQQAQSGDKSSEDQQQAQASQQQKSDDKTDEKQKSAVASGEQQPKDEKQEKSQLQATAGNNNGENSPEKQAVESWLRTIPDDPGGLLKRKFKHQFQNQTN